jgi:hypothetical protein
MATIESFQSRLRVAFRESLEKVIAEGDLPTPPEGEALFTAIENLALAAGDAASLEWLALQTPKGVEGPPLCPHCGEVGLHDKERERVLETRRGLQAPLSEPQCYCTGCRRSFFPSV